MAKNYHVYATLAQKMINQHLEFAYSSKHYTGLCAVCVRVCAGLSGWGWGGGGGGGGGG